MMNIEWTELEMQLYSLCAEEIRWFAQAHPAETFYGFALDCNSNYGEVFLCLNTPDDLHQTAIQYSISPPNKEAFDAIDRRMAELLGTAYEPRPLKPIDVNEKRLQWSLGDWKYHGFNRTEFDTNWGPYQELVSKACWDDEEDESSELRAIQDQFMRSACRVLVRLEATLVFSVLRQTDDFLTWVADHDEPDSDSWNRLDSMRREMAGA